MKFKSRLAMVMAFIIILAACGTPEPSESQESSAGESSGVEESSNSEEAVEALAPTTAVAVQEAVINVLASELSTNEISQEKKYIGTIEAEELLYISATSTTDKVIKVHKAVGDNVSAGDMLFQLDQEKQQDALAKAQLELEKAKAETDKMLGSTIDDIIYDADNSLDKHEDNVKLQERRIRDLENNIDIAEGAVKSAYNAYKALSNATDPADLIKAEMALESAEGALDIAKSALYAAEEIEENHQEDILESDILAREIYDKTIKDSVDEIKVQAEQLLEIAQLQYNDALKAVNDTIYTSPIDGVVYSVGVTENNMADPQAPSFILANNDQVVVKFSISQSDIATMEIGEKVIVEVESRQYSGTITEIPQSANFTNGSFMAVAVIDNANEEFVGGERVSVYLSSDVSENTIIVPLDSVYYEKDDNYVYIVEDGRAVIAPVKIGIFNDTDIEITDGLSNNDILITSWSNDLKNGVKVNIVE